jgi:hypothetical protein
MGGGVAMAVRTGPEAARDWAADTIPGMLGDDVVVARARSASSTTLKNGDSSTTSPRESQGPPDREI